MKYPNKKQFELLTYSQQLAIETHKHNTVLKEFKKTIKAIRSLKSTSKKCYKHYLQDEFNEILSLTHKALEEHKNASKFWKLQHQTDLG